MHRPGDEARELDRRWLESVASRKQIRVAARALAIRDDRILLQRLDYAEANWFFPGGEVELGETLEDAIRRELAEELVLDVARVVYRLTVNNRFQRDGHAVHQVEHFFEVTPASFGAESLEEHVIVDWHPLNRIRALDVRPWGVRDLVGIDGWRTVRLLEVE